MRMRGVYLQVIDIPVTITGDLWTDVTTLVSTPKEFRGCVYVKLQDWPAEYRESIFDIADRLLTASQARVGK